MSKRVKITFDRTCDYTVIPAKDIAETNAKIAENMKHVVREFKRKERESWNAVKDKIKNC